MPGKLFTWGAAANGRLGNGTTTPDVLVPAQIGSDTDWDTVAAGHTSTSAGHVVAIKNGQLLAWGLNSQSQVGDNTTTARTTPQTINTDSDWDMVAAGNQHSLAIKAGKLYVWGHGQDYKLGNGSTSLVAVETQYGSDTDWECVAAGAHFSAAIKGGKLFTCGTNTSGRTAQGTTSGETQTWTQVGSDTDWAYVVAGENFCLALKTDGTLWGWGSNQFGNIVGGVNPQTTPYQIGNSSDWTAISAGSFHSLGIRDNGKLFAWGLNDNGRTGLGLTSGNTTTVTQVGSDAGWNAVSAGHAYSLAIQDGKLFSWGFALNGRLGNNTTTPDVSAPAQIGSDTSWIAVEASNSSSLALQSDSVAPANTAAPTISGTAKVGQTLTTTDGTWTGTPTPTYAYQWKVADTSGGSYSNISGATSSTFTVTSAQAGKYIKAEVTATNVAGSATALSSASAQVVQDVANTALPTITTADDVLQVGSVMTSTDGSWDGSPAPTYAYQWQVSNDGDNSWTNISGATSSSITLQSAQGGKYVRLEVTATNSEGSEIAYSAASAFIAEDPVSVIAPTVSGQAKIEQILTADPGTWTGFPTPNFTYQWQRSDDGSTNWQTISGATSSTYLLGANDKGKYIRVTVQGSNTAGEAVASSAPTSPVAGKGNSTAAIVGALVASGAI